MRERYLRRPSLSDEFTVFPKLSELPTESATDKRGRRIKLARSLEAKGRQAHIDPIRLNATR